MSDLRVEIPTSRRRLSEVRPQLERALTDALPAGMFQSRWEDETLHLTGPGATATVTVEEGNIVGRARLQPPASMMRGLIEEKMTGLLRSVAEDGED